MTNGEKYLKDGVDIKQMATEMVDYFNFPPYEGIGEGNIEEFFGKEVKPTLTEDERVILRNIKSYDTIGRTESGYLIIRDRHTIPMEDDEYAYNSMYSFNHLFKFIKERRRISY